MIRDLRNETAGYQRPNMKWQCGGECHQCHLGPDSKGRCQAIAECRPVKNGDEWTCTRSQQLGGQCHCGPTSDGRCGLAHVVCKPKRSLRWWRGRITLAITLFTMGSLIFLFSIPERNQFLAPGPLTGSHAQLMHGDNRCAKCHGAGNGSLFQWTADAFTGGKQFVHSQSDLCMECHERTINRDLAMTPHNMTLEQLARLTEKAKDRSSQSSFVSASFASVIPDGKTPDQIACSTCHREHQGDNDLKKISDRKCQSCHQQSYNHFATDHPEFTGWPEHTSRTIKFDHVSHFGKHFKEKGKDFNCNSCHETDPFGNVQTVRAFQFSCAECHDQPIRESGESGWTMFALPMVDLEAIKNSMADVGHWPTAASGDFDGEIPAIMRLLLAADPQIQPALLRLGNDFQFIDVDPDDEQQVRDAVEVVWGIKVLLLDLSVNGKEAVRLRLESVLQTSIDDRQLSELTAGFDQSVFAVARQRWLPNLAAEISEKRPDFKLTKELTFLPGKNEIVAKLAREWIKQDEDTLAVNPLKDLVNPKSPIEPVQDNESQPTQPIVVNTNDNDLPKVVDSNQGSVRISNPNIPRSNSQGEVLAHNPLQELGLAPSTSSVESELPRVITPGQQPEENSQQPSSQSVAQNTNSSSDQSPNNDDLFLDVLASVMKHEPGGWYRNDGLFSISYRNMGHGDRYMKSWTEIANVANNAGVGPANQLFEKVNSPLFHGQCASCHTTAKQQISSDDIELDWHPVYRSAASSPITRFSHKPHLTQVELSNCKHCHELNTEQTTKLVSVGGEPARFSDFKPITKSNCVTCHQPGAAESHCTTCHSYHVSEHPK